MSRERDKVEIVCEVRRRTDKAVQIWDGSMHREPTTGRTVERLEWLPLSQLEATPDGFMVPEWLAREKGLI